MIEKIFNSLPPWALGAGFLIILICFLYLVIKDRIKMKNKWFSIDTKKFNPEAIILTFKEIMKVQRTMNRIEDKLIMREQMAYVEDEIKDISEELIRVHRHALQHKGVSKSDSENHPQIKMLTLIMDNMLNDLKGTVRERFKEMNELFTIEDNINESFSFIEEDFNKYFCRVSESLIKDSRRLVREKWVDNENIVIGRRESWESIQIILSENGKIGKIIKGMFTNAIDVLLKYNKEIRKLELEINEFIKKVTNGVG